MCITEYYKMLIVPYILSNCLSKHFFYKLLSLHHKYLRHGKLNKTQLTEPTVDCTLGSIQCSGVK